MRPDGNQVIDDLLRQARGGDYETLPQKIFGDGAAEAADALDEGSGLLIQAVAEGAGRKAEESLREQFKTRGERPGAKTPAPAPGMQFTETDKEIKATGETKKSFETKEAEGTRTQKAETTYVKDGKTFGAGRYSRRRPAFFR